MNTEIYTSGIDRRVVSMAQQMKTVSQLIAEGWNKELLYIICHMKDTPFFRTSIRGKFYVIEENLKAFVSTRRIGK